MKMSNLNANICSDQEVINYLEEYVQREEVAISKGFSGGLYIFIEIKSFFKNPNDQGRIKGFLRVNGFDAYCGDASRKSVPNRIKREEFLNKNKI